MAYKPVLKFKCPRCIGKIEKEVSLSNFSVPTDYYFSCPKCDSQIIIKYSFEFTVSGPIVKVLSVKEREITSGPAQNFRPKRKRTVKKRIGSP